MQWLLQRVGDTGRLAGALDRLGLIWSLHDIVPPDGRLVPEPEITDPGAVVVFGSYALLRHSEARGFRPGVFRLRPFVHEPAWRPCLLNGPDAWLLHVHEIGAQVQDGDRPWFFRPVEDSKAFPGQVMTASDIRETARKVLSPDPNAMPRGSLRPDTLMMLSPPARIAREWRVWVAEARVVTWSLYREGSRVTYRHEIDDDALDFAQALARLNPTYAPVYVMDIGRTDAGLRLLETSCVNAAGFYAADLMRLAATIDALG